MSKFDDRLAPVTFQDDEKVAVLLGTSRTPAGPWVSEAWVPERLFERLIALGGGYRLHALGTLSSGDDSTLNAQQCEGLADELAFVVQLVPADAALGEAIARVMPLVLKAARSGGRLRLVVAPP